MVLLDGNSEQAVKYFKEGYNCSQAVLITYCEKLGLDKQTALMLSSSFGGGIGRLREVCGAASGMFMVAGLKLGYIEPKDINKKEEHYRLIQQLAKEFEKINCSLICREILGLDIHHDKPKPEERTENYYKKRPCVEVVRSAAQIIDKALFQTG